MEFNHIKFKEEVYAGFKVYLIIGLLGIALLTFIGLSS